MSSSNFSGTRYESGSESGWTMYLEESSFDSENRFQRISAEDYRGDLSMISDASSGPPNEIGFDHENYRSFSAVSGSKSEVGFGNKEKMNRNNKNMKQNQHSSSYLDDTASSPVFGFSKKEMNSYAKEGFVENVPDFSHDNSRKHLAKKQTSIFQSSSAKKSARKCSGELQDAKWE